MFYRDVLAFQLVILIRVWRHGLTTYRLYVWSCKKIVLNNDFWCEFHIMESEQFCCVYEWKYMFIFTYVLCYRVFLKGFYSFIWTYYCAIIFQRRATTSHVRHGVSNLGQIQWPVNSPHKGPVMQKVSCAMTLLYHDHFQSALLALCERNPLTGGFHSQRPVTRSFDVLSDARLNTLPETPWRSSWRQCNDTIMIYWTTWLRFGVSTV